MSDRKDKKPRVREVFEEKAVSRTNRIRRCPSLGLLRVIDSEKLGVIF